MDDKARRALEVDMDALNSNLVPEWLLLRTLCRLGVIQKDTFTAALKEEVELELGSHHPDPDYRDQLERVVELMSFQ